jgi:hypothetical protein
MTKQLLRYTCICMQHADIPQDLGRLRIRVWFRIKELESELEYELGLGLELR